MGFGGPLPREEDPFSASWARKSVFSRCRGDRTSVYLTKPFFFFFFYTWPPLGLFLHLPGFSRSSPLLLRGNFNYRQHFFNQHTAYYGQMRRCGRPGTSISSPVNLGALSHAQGAVTRQGRGGHASRWCVSIRRPRGNAHIWRGLYLLPALLLGDCGLSSFCKALRSLPERRSPNLWKYGGFKGVCDVLRMLWFLSAHVSPE